MRAAGPEAAWRYAGPVGPIDFDALALSGSGTKTLLWDGGSVACEKDDDVSRCRIEPGRYRLEATVYSTATVQPVSAFVVHRRRQKEPRVLGVSVSPPFLITGPPSLEPLSGALRGQASHWVKDLPVAEGYWTLGSDWFVDEGGPLQHGARGWCRSFRPRAPMTGTFEVCAPESAVSEDGVQVRDFALRTSGAPTWPPNVIRGTAAWDSAIALVSDAEVLGYVGWPSTAAGIQRSIRYSYYRPDLHAWLVAVHTRGGQDALVRVPDSGPACAVGRFADLTPYKLEREAFECS